MQCSDSFSKVYSGTHLAERGGEHAAGGGDPETHHPVLTLCCAVLCCPGGERVMAATCDALCAVACAADLPV